MNITVEGLVFAAGAIGTFWGLFVAFKTFLSKHDDNVRQIALKKADDEKSIDASHTKIREIKEDISKNINPRITDLSKIVSGIDKNFDELLSQRERMMPYEAAKAHTLEVIAEELSENSTVISKAYNQQLEVKENMWRSDHNKRKGE